MGKERLIFACTACAHPASQWVGRCPACGAWGTIEESGRATSRGPVAVAPLAGEGAEDRRISTGSDGVDRVLGGGLVAGSVMLLAGEPGIGKSTLLLQLAASVGTVERPALYASGEESRAQVAARAARLGIDAGRISFVSGRELATVVDAVVAVRPPLVVVDSIQAIRDPEQPTLAGGTSQVRACADALVGLAKREGIPIVLAGQVTKDGDVAGPRTLEHAVDVVCAFEGDTGSGLRILACGKNRFGEEGEMAWFEMTRSGLRGVDPPALASDGAEPGAATAIVRAGRGALAVEVQALAAWMEGPGRRSVSGLDPRRFGLLAAVVDRALGLRLSRAELYGASSGGLRVDDPAADLAVAAALASSATGVRPPAAAAFVGEVTLTGRVRPAPNVSARLRAAVAAGIETVFAAEGTGPGGGLDVVEVRGVADALRWCRATADATRAGRSGSRRSRSSSAVSTGKNAADLGF